MQRFFAADLPWTKLLVQFFQAHLFSAEHEFILASDRSDRNEKRQIDARNRAAKRGFREFARQVVSGLEFFVFSLVDVAERKAYPLWVKQTVRSEAEQAAIKLRRKKRSKKSSAKPKGRRKGSLNKDKNELNLSPELLRINELLSNLLQLIRVFVKIKYVALDGHFGHPQAVLMALENDLHVHSKLRKDAALYEKYEGEYGGRGAKKKYGNRLKYDLLPTKYLKKSEQTGEIITRLLSRDISAQRVRARNKCGYHRETKLENARRAGHAILFSSDGGLSWEKMLDYYSLRFQIEFNFRDAKQHFGLEDFMNTTPRGVENAANLAFLMVNVSAKLLKESDENVSE